MTFDEIPGLSMIRTTRSVSTRPPNSLGRIPMSARGAQFHTIAASSSMLATRRKAVAALRREHK